MQKINTARFRPAEYLRTVWYADAEQGMVPEDLLEPAAWANIAAQCKPLDIIQVGADDASWWAEYLVVDAHNLWLKVRLLRKEIVEATPNKARPGQQAEYTVKYRGVKKWSVVRKGDNAIIKDGFQTREDADEHLNSHVKAMAA